MYGGGTEVLTKPEYPGKRSLDVAGVRRLPTRFEIGYSLSRCYRSFVGRYYAISEEYDIRIWLSAHVHI